MSSTYSRRLPHRPRRLLLSLVILTWLSAAALLAADRGAERRMGFDGAAQR